LSTHCGSPTGRKLDRDSLLALADTFFVRGTLVRAEYGAAPVLPFNEYHHRKTEIEVNERLLRDANLLGEAAGVGFFHYGPRLWMLGEVEPLKALHDASTRDHVVERILKEFPERTLSPSQRILRLRRNPNPPTEPSEYDAPPVGQRGNGRIDAEDFPVLYASQDVEVCVHECRVTVEDDLYMATLTPLRDLRLLDLTAVLEEDVTEFDSLDMAVHMLFHAAPHSYAACRDIATAASRAGYDGVAYPSYFSTVRTGAIPEAFFPIGPGQMIIANGIEPGAPFDRNFADDVIFHESGPPSGWPLGHILRTLNAMTRETVEGFADCF
jgi:RES domain